MVINTASSNIANNLKSTQALLSRALGRLASSSKINLPQDDAAALSMSLRLRNSLTQTAAGESNLTSMASLIHTQNGVLKTLDQFCARGAAWGSAALDSLRSPSLHLTPKG